MCCDGVHALALPQVPHLHRVVVTPSGNMEARKGEPSSVVELHSVISPPLIKALDWAKTFCNLYNVYMYRLVYIHSMMYIHTCMWVIATSVS